MRVCGLQCGAVLLLLCCALSVQAEEDWSKLKIRQLRHAAEMRGIASATFLSKDDFVNALTEYAKTDLVTHRQSLPARPKADILRENEESGFRSVGEGVFLTVSCVVYGLIVVNFLIVLLLWIGTFKTFKTAIKEAMAAAEPLNVDGTANVVGARKNMKLQEPMLWIRPAIAACGTYGLQKFLYSFDEEDIYGWAEALAKDKMTIMYIYSAFFAVGLPMTAFFLQRKFSQDAPDPRDDARVSS
jgi:hypothetical protein